MVGTAEFFFVGKQTSRSKHGFVKLFSQIHLAASTSKKWRSTTIIRTTGPRFIIPFILSIPLALISHVRVSSKDYVDFIKK